MFTNSDMTLYNKVPQQGIETEKYTRTQIENVFWNESTETVNGENGLKKEEVLRLLISKDSMQELEKEYIKPKEWLKSNEKDKYYTFQNGDIVVKGLVDKDIVSSKELEKEYDNVLSIVSITDNRYGNEDMQHFFIRAE